jgi:hypothetical protein
LKLAKNTVLVPRMIMEKGEIPNEWKERVIIKLLKKGDLTKCDNWRPRYWIHQLQKGLQQCQ